MRLRLRADASVRFDPVGPHQSQPLGFLEISQRPDTQNQMPERLDQFPAAASALESSTSFVRRPRKVANRVSMPHSTDTRGCHPFPLWRDLGSLHIGLYPEFSS